MNNVLLAILLVLMFGCAAPKTVRVYPPSAYLQLQALPLIPQPPVSNKALANYIFALHDDDMMCRTQIGLIQSWANQGKKNAR